MTAETKAAPRRPRVNWRRWIFDTAVVGALYVGGWLCWRDAVWEGLALAVVLLLALVVFWPHDHDRPAN